MSELSMAFVHYVPQSWLQCRISNGCVTAFVGYLIRNTHLRLPPFSVCRRSLSPLRSHPFVIHVAFHQPRSSAPCNLCSCPCTLGHCGMLSPNPNDTLSRHPRYDERSSTLYFMPFMALN